MPTSDVGPKLVMRTASSTLNNITLVYNKILFKVPPSQYVEQRQQITIYYIIIY